MAFQNLGGLLIRGATLGIIKTAEEKVKTNKDGTVHTVKYVIQWAEQSTRIPAYYSSDPIYPGLVLKDIDCDKWMGKLAKVTLTYGPQENGPPVDGLPPTEISESSTVCDIDIQQHPDFNDDTKFPNSEKLTDPPDDPNGRFIAFKKGTLCAGVTNYGVGGKNVTVTSYHLGRPSSDNIYVRSAPPGYGGQWLRISSDVNPSGKWFTKRNTYQKSEGNPALLARIYKTS